MPEPTNLETVRIWQAIERTDRAVLDAIGDAMDAFETGMRRIRDALVLLEAASRERP